MEKPVIDLKNSQAIRRSLKRASSTQLYISLCTESLSVKLKYERSDVKIKKLMKWINIKYNIVIHDFRENVYTFLRSLCNFVSHYYFKKFNY